MMKPRVENSAFSMEAIFPNWHNEEWVSYTLKSVLEGISSENIKIGATVMAKASHVHHSYVHPVMPGFALRLFGKYIKQPVNYVYRASRSRLKAGDVAYFWLNSPKKFCQEFKSRGIMVAREMINCTLELRRTELRKAYSALHMPDGSGISDADIAREREELLAADIIFCPNSYVKASVTAYGFPAEQCIETSYGWSEKKLSGTQAVIARDGTFTAAFVGTVDVRKGAPVLLEAWAKSKVSGRLLIAGNISPEISAQYADILNRPDVICLGHVHDVGSVYRAADAFCFPTWEEGGPQVTFEAMALGNVPIVTAMGTGGAFSEADDVGIVIPPGDVDALSDALQRMAHDPAQRQHLSEQARLRARLFTWDLVGQRRREALLQQRARWLDRAG